MNLTAPNPRSLPGPTQPLYGGTAIAPHDYQGGMGPGFERFPSITESTMEYDDEYGHQPEVQPKVLRHQADTTGVTGQDDLKGMRQEQFLELMIYKQLIPNLISEEQAVASFHAVSAGLSTLTTLGFWN